MSSSLEVLKHKRNDFNKYVDRHISSIILKMNIFKSDKDLTWKAKVVKYITLIRYLTSYNANIEKKILNFSQRNLWKKYEKIYEKFIKNLHLFKTTGQNFLFTPKCIVAQVKCVFLFLCVVFCNWKFKQIIPT